MRAWSSAVSATTSVPSRRRSTSWPVSFSSSAAKSGHSAWLRRPSAISFSSPGSASAHAASMPAAAWLAPDPAAARSNKVTAAPRWASRQAIPSPMTPAPMISAVGVSVDRRWTVAIGGSLRWHDPDRFDGFDLSRVLRHPRPSDPIIGSLARSGKAFTARLGAAAECQAPRRRSHRRGLLPQQPRNEHTHQQHDGAAERESRHGSEMDQAEAVEQRSNRLAHEEEERMQRHRRAARARGDLRRLHLDAAVQHVEPEPDESEDRHLRRPRNSDRGPEQRKRRHGCPAQHQAVGAEFSEQRADHQGVDNPAQGEPAQNQTRDRSSRFASVEQKERHVGEQAQDRHAFEKHRGVADPRARVGEDRTEQAGDGMDVEVGSHRLLLPGKTESRGNERGAAAAADHDEYAAPSDQVGNGAGKRSAEEISGDHYGQIPAERDLSFRHWNEIADDGERDREYSAGGNAGEDPRSKQNREARRRGADRGRRDQDDKARRHDPGLAEG